MGFRTAKTFLKKALNAKSQKALTANSLKIKWLVNLSESFLAYQNGS